MIEKILDDDGLFELPPAVQTSVSQKQQTTIKLLSGLDGATVTIGTKNEAGTFFGYDAGELTVDFVVNHGRGATLWAKVENYSTDILIGYTG